jgi:hypothetical protein
MSTIWSRRDHCAYGTTILTLALGHVVERERAPRGTRKGGRRWERRRQHLATAPGHQLGEGLGLSADLGHRVSAMLMVVPDATPLRVRARALAARIR